MTVHTVTTSSNLATVNSSMASGDTMLFTAGTYTVGTALNLTNGCFYLGNPGAILHASSTNDLFDMTTGTNNNIQISGLQFDGGNGASNAGIFIVGNNGTNTPGNISITNCTFTNFSGTVSGIFVFQMDNIRIDNNTFSNVYQAMSIHNNDSIGHGNFSLCGNIMKGVARFGIECQGTGGTGNGPINNLNVCNNVGVDINLMLSLVDNSNTSTGVNIIGNQCWGGNGIETANSNTLIVGNVFTNGAEGLLISHGPNTIIYGNVFRNVAAPFAEDGGWLATQWVGVNMINGVATSGWSGHPNDVTITPPNFAVQTQAQVLAALVDTGTAGRITPAVMRSIIQSTALPGGYIFPSWYP